MAFASELELEEEIKFVSPGTRKGKWIRQTYSWTQANTDGGGTITPGKGTIKDVQITGNIVDKPSNGSFTATVATITNNATAGPTSGSAVILILEK